MSLEVSIFRSFKNVESWVITAENPANFTALGKMLKPNEIAEVIEFLCSQRSSGMTGTNLVVDAGWHIASSWTQFGGVRKN